MTVDMQDFAGEIKSPNGFVFGIVGWMWGERRPRSITFFLDGTALVGDQYGRPIRGSVVDDGKGNRKEVRFAMTPPPVDDRDPTQFARAVEERAKCATHRQVIEALTYERVDWRTLVSAGWPQLPYEMLKEMPRLPPTPIEELYKIKDTTMRRDAMRARIEADTARTLEAQVIEVEIAAVQAEIGAAQERRKKAMAELVEAERKNVNLTGTVQ